MKIFNQRKKILKILRSLQSLQYQFPNWRPFCQPVRRADHNYATDVFEICNNRLLLFDEGCVLTNDFNFLNSILYWSTAYYDFLLEVAYVDRNFETSTVYTFHFKLLALVKSNFLIRSKIALKFVFSSEKEFLKLKDIEVFGTQI